MINYDEEIFKIPARRCKRCGGLLTSEQSLRDGYGHHCRSIVRAEAAEREETRNQYSLWEVKRDA